MTRRILLAVIASVAKQSIFRSIHLKENGLPRPLRGLAMTVSWVKCPGSWYYRKVVDAGLRRHHGVHGSKPMTIGIIPPECCERWIASAAAPSRNDGVTDMGGQFAGFWYQYD
jgi:hypothetical protein